MTIDKYSVASVCVNHANSLSGWCLAGSNWKMYKWYGSLVTTLLPVLNIYVVVRDHSIKRASLKFNCNTTFESQLVSCILRLSSCCQNLTAIYSRNIWFLENSCNMLLVLQFQFEHTKVVRIIISYFVYNSSTSHLRMVCINVSVLIFVLTIDKGISFHVYVMFCLTMSLVLKSTASQSKHLQSNFCENKKLVSEFTIVMFEKIQLSQKKWNMHNVATRDSN